MTPTVTQTPSWTPSPTPSATPTITPTVTPTATPAYPDESIQTPTNGFSLTVVDGVTHLYLNPAGPLCSGSITMPPNPVNEQTLEVLTSEQISLLTLNANTGQELTPNPPQIMLAGSGFSYRYLTSLGTWFRRW